MESSRSHTLKVRTQIFTLSGIGADRQGFKYLGLFLFSLLVLFAFMRPTLARSPFKPVSKQRLKRLGTLEREYYNNKVGEIYMVFEQIERRKKKSTVKI